MTDVCFVLMPYAAIERPSLALGLLKTSLQQSGITSTVLYPNIWFAAEIGLFSYSTLINASDPSMLIGEWTFSKAAFPDFQADDEQFLSLVTARFNNLDEVKQILLEVRDKATAFVEQVAQSVLELQPRIVACSSTFEQHCASLALLRRIRELDPAIVTFMGGANCEGIMGQVTKQEFPWVDFVVSGEGDKVVPALCQKLLEKGRDINPKELPYGVIGASNSSNGEVSVAAPRVSVENLDGVPIPNYNDYFETLRKSWINPFVDPGLPVETSRGCWWGQKKHCTFCGLNGQGITYRSKSPARVVEEFSHLSKQYGIRKFQVVDNILDMNHVNTILPIFEALEEPYTLFYETKANLRHQQLEQLFNAGVRIIQPGIESMHDSALKLINKGNTALMNVQLLKWAQELGMSVIWNYLVKIPGEADEWYKETAEWLPLIFHLQAPTGSSKIRYDRFSLYHERTADYGLKLLPSRAYQYVYPISPEVMVDFAYYFEDQNDLAEQKALPSFANSAKLDKPGYRALTELVDQWQALFNNPEIRPVLNMYKEGEKLRIVDTRPCATHDEHILSGLAYWIYQVCDSIQTSWGIGEALRTKRDLNVSGNEIQLVIDELLERKILLQVNGRFLSLAVKSPFPPLIGKPEAPAGFVNLPHYYQSIRQLLSAQPNK